MSDTLPFLFALSEIDAHLSFAPGILKSLERVVAHHTFKIPPPLSGSY